MRAWTSPTNHSEFREMETSPYNNVLIRSGEAPAIGWSRNMLHSGFNISPRSVFWSADSNGRSDNTDVIHLQLEKKHERMETRNLLLSGLALRDIDRVLRNYLRGNSIS